MRRTHFICTVDGCGEPHLARGMCKRHYRQVATNGVVTRLHREAVNAGTCIAPKCSERARKKKMCAVHYDRFKKRGSFELEPRRLPAEAFLEDNAHLDRPECVDWPYTINTHGYGEYKRLKDGRTRSIRAHREMCRIAHGEPPFPDAVAAHWCGNRACVNPGHLRWATKKENADDMLMHGTRLRGDAWHPARLTEAQVLEIRNDPRPPRMIAKDYPIAASYVWHVKNGKTWRHLEKDFD